MNKLYAALMVVLLSGCVTMGVPYADRMESWVGHPTSELVEKWGYPTRTFESPEGGEVYAYELSSQGVSPTFQTPTQSNTYGTMTKYGYIGNTVTTPGVTMGGQPFTEYCFTYFEVDSDNAAGIKMIVNWRYKGNACR